MCLNWRKKNPHQIDQNLMRMLNVRGFAFVCPASARHIDAGHAPLMLQGHQGFSKTNTNSGIACSAQYLPDRHSQSTASTTIFFDLSTDCDTDILRKSVENFFIHD